MNPIVEHHRNQIAGALSCFDRVIITGTLPDIAYAEAMVRHLDTHHTRLVSWPRIQRLRGVVPPRPRKRRSRLPVTAAS
jgi:hypothetical protein